MSLRYARALYDYNGQSANELSFKVGDVVIVTEERNDGWWGGHLNGKDGFFPANYVTMIQEQENDHETGETNDFIGINTQSTNGPGASMNGQSKNPRSKNGSVELQNFYEEKENSTERPKKEKKKSLTADNFQSNPVMLGCFLGTDKPTNSEYNVNMTDDGKVDGSIQIADPDEENWWTRDKQKRCSCCPWNGCVMSKNQYRLFLCTICGLFSLVLFLIILYTVVPLIINKVMAASVLTFTSVQITQPDSQAGTMQLSATGAISNTGGVSAIVGEMTMTVAQVLNGQNYPLGTIQMQPLEIKGDPTIVSVVTTFKVTNISSFNTFVHSMIFEPYIIWHVSAVASVTPTFGAIKMPTFSGIDFQKTLNITACNGLLGVTLNVFDLSHSNFTNIIVSLSVAIQNPSIFSISPMGDLTFDMYTSDNQFLGSVFAPNAQLAGPITTSLVNMTGLISPSNLTATNALINTFLQGFDSTVFAATPAIASSIPLYNAGMQGLRLKTIVAGNKINLVQTMQMNSMSLFPSSTDTTVLFSASAAILLYSPLGPNSPLIVNSLNMNADMIWNNLTIATLAVPTVPVRAEYGKSADGKILPVTLNFAVNLAANMKLAGDGTAFTQFVQAFLQSPNILVRIKGFSSAFITYALGNMTATDFPLDASAQVLGMGGLTNTVVQQTIINGDRTSSQSMSNQQLESSDKDEMALAAIPTTAPCTSLCGLNVKIIASIFNPSNASITLPGGRLIMTYAGVVMGALSGANLVMVPGYNTVTLSGFMNPPQSALPTVSQFMSNFLNGLPSTVNLAGEAASLSALVTASGSPSAAALLVSGMSLSSVVQQPYQPLMSNFIMQSFGLIFAADQSVTANGVVVVTLTLPSNIKMSLTTLSTSLTFDISVYANGVWASMGTVQNTGSMNVTQTGSGQVFQLTAVMQGVPVSVSPNQLIGFTDFASVLLGQPKASFLLSGMAFPQAQTNLGIVSLANIPVASNISLIGYNGFKDLNGNTLMNIQKLDMTAATASTISITTTLVLTNPSQVYLQGAGPLTMDMYYSKQGDTSPTLLGYVTIPAFNLGLGQTTFTASGTYFASPNSDTGRDFLSNYVNYGSSVNKIASSISLTGKVTDPNAGTSTSGTNIRILQPAINTFATNTIVPGLSSPLITQFTLNTGYALNPINIAINGGNILCPTKVTVANPFHVPIYITGGDLLVTIIQTSTKNGVTTITSSNQIGSWTASGLDILINPAATTVTTPINVKVIVSLTTITTVFGLLGGSNVFITSTGTLNVIIGGQNGFATTLNVIADNVPSVTGA